MLRIVVIVQTLGRIRSDFTSKISPFSCRFRSAVISPPHTVCNAHQCARSYPLDLFVPLFKILQWAIISFYWNIKMKVIVIVCHHSSLFSLSGIFRLYGISCIRMSPILTMSLSDVSKLKIRCREGNSVDFKFRILIFFGIPRSIKPRFRTTQQGFSLLTPATPTWFQPHYWNTFMYLS